MTLYKLIQILKEIGLSQPLVRTAGEGDIYNALNGNPSTEYGVFFVTQQMHSSDEYFDHYALVLFYVDRLVHDMDDNRLQIQSIGKEILDNVIKTFLKEYEDVEVTTVNFTTFTQQFQDETAGAYAQLTFDIPKDFMCPEEYE